jgi:hypothetical protein
MRYGIKPAPEGCGDPEDGACFGCIVRHMRRSIRQLLPLKYVASYKSGGSAGCVPGERNPEYANFDVWRMWFGRVFAHRHIRHQIAA